MNDKIINVVHAGFNCRHNKYYLDNSLANVKCGICNESLNPLWVIRELANEENRYFMQMQAYENIVKKAEAKNKCKCEKCGEMTRIER